MGARQAALEALQRVRKWYETKNKNKPGEKQTYYEYGKEVVGREGAAVQRKKKQQQTMNELFKNQ